MNEVDNFTEFIKGRTDTQTLTYDKLPGDFIVERGLAFAGYHLLADFWGARRLDDSAYLEKALREAVTAAGATLLDLKLHVFSPTGGISGLALLSESHISIHTWPEFGFAALDIFMCGDASPHRALTALKSNLKPTALTIGEHKRGVTP